MSAPQAPGTPAGTGAPSAPEMQVQQQPATAPVVPPPPAQDPNWLTPRLDQARRSGAADAERALMAELGVTNRDELKAAVAAQKAAADAQKNAEQRALEAGQRATTTEAELARYKNAVASQATAELAGLTEAQRTAVVAVAGDDHARQLTTIVALRPTWATSAPVAPAAAPATPATPAAPAQPAAPATTAPPANSAPAPTNESPTDHKAEYARLKATNPFAAADYLNRNHAAIYPH